jgi:transcriptional regulator with XRE-family HTH domain
MTDQVVVPQIRGDIFTQGRERAGLSVLDLAKMASLTASHIEQIENGECTSFYSPAIKLVAAKKIAGILGLTDADCFIFPEGVAPISSRSTQINQSSQLANQLHVSIAKDNFDQLLRDTQEIDGKKTKVSRKKITIYLVVAVFFIGLFFSLFARADIVGMMPAYGERLVITSETCKWENGREEPNWLFAYFETAFGVVSRACYIRYNNQIWLRRASGVEMVFPAEYFKAPSNPAEAVKN